MTTVVAPNIHRLVIIPPDPHQRMFMPELTVGMLLWLHHSRKSSLGGYIGTFSEVWQEAGWVGPKSNRFSLLMEYVEADTAWLPI